MTLAIYLICFLWRFVDARTFFIKSVIYDLFVILKKCSSLLFANTFWLSIIHFSIILNFYIGSPSSPYAHKNSFFHIGYTYNGSHFISDGMKAYMSSVVKSNLVHCYFAHMKINKFYLCKDILRIYQRG
ncbi:hypothetical protein QQ045_027667 [Rhodiola kirilowii]